MPGRLQLEQNCSSASRLDQRYNTQVHWQIQPRKPLRVTSELDCFRAKEQWVWYDRGVKKTTHLLRWSVIRARKRLERLGTARGPHSTSTHVSTLFHNERLGYFSGKEVVPSEAYTMAPERGASRREDRPSRLYIRGREST
jgi:hypothetical protein